MVSYVMQTASEIKTEVYAADSRLGSYISQTATSIRQEVYSAESSIRSSITQNANKIALVVDGNNNIKAAQIVASINNGSSSVIISADHINLDGYVKATDITADLIKTKVEAADRINVSSLYIANGETPYGSINWMNVNSSLFDVRITQSGDTYTLQKKTWVSNWANVGSFSRATTLSGAWSSGTFTVNASPQENRFSTQILQGVASWDGTTVTIPIEAIDSDNPNYQYATGRSVVATYPGGGTSNIYLKVRRNGGSDVTTLTNGERVTLYAGEYCEVDIYNDNEIIKWGEVEAPGVTAKGTKQNGTEYTLSPATYSLNSDNYAYITLSINGWGTLVVQK